MAEMNIPEKKGKRRMTIMPRVDLTPMVDLGFLLITFFMLTTTMANENVVEINAPIPHHEPTAFIDTSTITLIPTKEHQVAYYHGALEYDDEIQLVNHNEVRQIITQKQSDLKYLPESFSKQAHQLHVLIKPDDRSTYEDLVRIIDEMLINNVQIYAITDADTFEQRIINERF